MRFDFIDGGTTRAHRENQLGHCLRESGEPVMSQRREAAERSARLAGRQEYVLGGRGVDRTVVSHHDAPSRPLPKPAIDVGERPRASELPVRLSGWHHIIHGHSLDRFVGSCGSAIHRSRQADERICIRLHRV